MIISVFKKVFNSVNYWLIAISIAALVLVFSAWLPNFKLIGQIISSSAVSVLDKMSILLKLLGSFPASLSTLAFVLITITAILFGINIVMFIYFLKNSHGGEVKGFTAGFGGIVSGIFGFGCAACGSVILGSVLGASGLLAALPLAGGEFSFLGVVLLSLSIYIISKRIYKPATCSVN